MKIICSLDLNYTNHLDHFVPLCDLLSAPLFVYSQEDVAQLTRYYPPIKYRLIEQDASMFSHIAEESDVLITSIIETGEYLSRQTEFQTGKIVPHIFLPHGQSDKAYIASRMVTNAPFRFVYGSYMKKQISDQQAQVQTMLTLGNYRKDYYLKHKAFFDQFTPFDTFTKQKTILYAPTWNDHENSSSIEKGYHLIDELAQKYNLIIKLHPLSLRDQPGYYYAIEEKAKKYPHVFFASSLPLVYPLLAAADIYLGDYSSIGYDFLFFDRPLFFLTPEKATKCDKGNALLSCGYSLSSIEDLESIKDTYSENRQRHYNYAFGKTDPDLINKIAKLVDNR